MLKLLKQLLGSHKKIFWGFFNPGSLNSTPTGEVNADLRSLIEDRKEQLQKIEDDTDLWSIAAVDFMDELRMMEKSYSEKDKDFVNHISMTIRNQLLSLNVELIDCNDWTPDKQRAISVTVNPDTQQAKILRKGATGIVINGHLIRKQEVILELPEQKGDAKYV